MNTARLPRYALALALLLPLGAQALTPVPKVVGGYDADIAFHTYAAALVDPAISTNFSGRFCTGTLINPSWVLTAAHCVDGSTADSVVVVIGEQTLSNDATASATSRIVVDAVMVHPDYNANNMAHDIAVLHLATPSAAGAAMPPGYPLTWDGGTTNYNTYEELVTNPDALLPELTVIGYGMFDDTFGTFRPVLQGADLDFISRADCDSANYYNFTLASDTFCAALLDPANPADILPDIDSCFGDSGGPILLAGTNQILGVVSYGPGECGSILAPGGYASVDLNIDFINYAITASEIGVAITTVDTTPGDSILEFQITVTNNSPVNAAPAFDLVLAQTLGWAFVDLDADGCSSTTFSCPVGALAAGASQVFLLRVDTATNTGVFLQVVSPILDANPNNDSATGTLGTTSGPGIGLLNGGGGGSLPPLALVLMAGLLGLRRRR